MKLRMIFILSFFLINSAFADTIKISGPPVMESLPFALMSGMEISRGTKFEFIAWNSPDKARAMIAGGQIDGAILTTHAAALFRKKGLDIKIPAFFEGSLWVVSDENHVFTKKEDIKGRFLFPFGPGEMPEIILNASLGKLPEKVVKVHTGGAFEAVNFLLLKRGDHALLSEPSASMAVKKSFKNAGPFLVKTINLKDVWEDKFNRKLLLSCLAMINKASSQRELAGKILLSYKIHAEKLKNDPRKNIEIIAKSFPSMSSLGRLMDFTREDIVIISGEKAFSDALFFLGEVDRVLEKKGVGAETGMDLFMETDFK